MNEMEMKARANHRNGNNCSASLAMAFAEEREIMSKLTVCLRHISEVFLYEYYCLGDDEYEISEEDTLTPHKTKAKELLLSGDYAKAQQEWLSAHLENPVDMEAIDWTGEVVTGED